jgi:O-acetyl-ADP-ribose deacetylase (regulator of RNase III)
MLSFITGNIFSSNAQAIVNTVNCVGVMGRGIALQFKRAYPDNFTAYAKACKSGEVVPGKMFVHQTNSLMNPQYIINFPTKRHWRGASRIDDIILGLEDIKQVIKENEIMSIAIPPLGAGLGGLDWQLVKSEIIKTLADVDIEITVYEPSFTPDSSSVIKNIKVPNMTVGRAALIGLSRRYLDGLLDPMISLLEIHKLMYFLQVSGEPLKLAYVKAPFGPYAENLRHVLNVIEGHFISGYIDGGDAPDKTIELEPRAVNDAEIYLAKYNSTCERMKRVTDLVQGFETPFGLELLSTVHWVVTRQKANSLSSVIRHTYEWNERKQQFSKKQIEIAVNRLVDTGWIPKIELLWLQANPQMA